MKKLLTATALILLATTATAKDIKYGAWTYSETVDAVTLETEAHISSDATEGATEYGHVPYYAVSCNAMYFGNVAVLDNADILIRFEGNAEPSPFYGRMWQGNSGLTAGYINKRDWIKGRYKKGFANSMRDKAAYVRFSMYAEPDLTARFNMKGFNAAITHLASTCSK